VQSDTSPEPDLSTKIAFSAKPAHKTAAVVRALQSGDHVRVVDLTHAILRSRSGAKRVEALAPFFTPPVPPQRAQREAAAHRRDEPNAHANERSDERAVPTPARSDERLQLHDERRAALPRAQGRGGAPRRE
jgi:hypothetical protein